MALNEDKFMVQLAQQTGAQAGSVANSADVQAELTSQWATVPKNATYQYKLKIKQ